MRACFAPLWLAALAACSSPTAKQLEAVKSARSVVAEWALMEQQAAGGRAPATYVEQMRKMAKDQLKTAEEGLISHCSIATIKTAASSTTSKWRNARRDCGK